MALEQRQIYQRGLSLPALREDVQPSALTRIFHI
jgi:hypothetical protein